MLFLYPAVSTKQLNYKHLPQILMFNLHFYSKKGKFIDSDF